ncbi:MAG: SCO family protein [Burkholderiaceae bacterium]
MIRPLLGIASVLVAASGAAPALAQTAADGTLQAVAELARANGQALACREAAAAQRAKALMLELAPKTERVAGVFDEGTQNAFIAQTRGGEACPTGAELAARLDALAQRLRGAVAGLAHAQIADDSELPRHSVPRYLLQGPGGRAVTAEDYRGRFQLVAFGFTSCPDVCPTTMLEMKQTLDALGERAAKLQPVFVTIDPQRDTLQVVEAYTKAFDPRIVGLTGSEALVSRAAENFRVRYRKVQESGAAPNVYTMEHTAGMFLLGPDGQLLERIVYGTTVREIVTRIGRWMDAGAER